ncbi:MAG: hypothetical protein HZC43_09410 [Nitrosomonadales bacterium]|nr:hypothetical protein [Nitrosomonadales bacterium]
MRYLLMVLLFAGCSTLEKIAQDEPVEESKKPSQDAKKIADAKRLCTKKYGYLPGSSTFEKCMEDNAPGLKAEIEKTLEKEKAIADARLKCEQDGLRKDTDAYFSCVTDTLENALRATAKKQRR